MILNAINSENFSRNKNKIQKLLREQGAGVVLKKFRHLAAKKFGGAPVERTLLRHEEIIKELDNEDMYQDIESVLSFGLFRPLGEIKSDIRRLPAEDAYDILEEANRILENEFTIYGNLKMRLSDRHFSWLRDPFSTFVWPLDSGSSRIFAQKVGVDIKNIWEIARFQFLMILSYAYILSDDERYARFAIEKVNSWIDENPFPYGPHWAMAMEASIRLMNWCFYLPLLDVFKFCDRSLHNKLSRSFLEHLIYIRENLEVSPSQATNHYLSNLSGLLLGRLIFPSLSWAVECSEFAERELDREIQRQFKTIGINFEGSLPYHRLSSEICLIGAALIKKSGRDLPARIDKRLREVDNFTRYYTDTCGECPTVGDNDSGIFVKFFNGQELNRHRYLKYLFDCILWNKNTPGNWDEFLCSIHFTNTNRPSIFDSRKLIKKQKISVEVKNFDGLVISRYGNEALFFNTLRSSEGHTHNDKLSIYPVIGGKLLFVDRGSFSYTGFMEKRHEDRMTSSHNGPVINGWEQNRIWKDDLFYINGDANCNNRIDCSESVVTITGWHTGYRRHSPGMKVFRKLKWDTIERNMLITDWVENKKKHKDMLFTWYFLLNPDWTGVMENSTLVLKNEGNLVYFDDIDGIGFTLTQGLYCPSYQVESPCQALKTSRTAATGKKTHFLLRY